MQLNQSYPDIIREKTILVRRNAIGSLPRAKRGGGGLQRDICIKQQQQNAVKIYVYNRYTKNKTRFNTNTKPETYTNILFKYQNLKSEITRTKLQKRHQIHELSLDINSNAYDNGK